MINWRGDSLLLLNPGQRQWIMDIVALICKPVFVGIELLFIFDFLTFLRRHPTSYFAAQIGPILLKVPGRCYCRFGGGYAAHNLAVVHHIVFNLLRLHTSPSQGQHQVQAPTRLFGQRFERETARIYAITV